MELKFWLHGLAAMAIVALAALATFYITSQVIRVTAGFEEIITCAIFFGLIWLEVKAYEYFQTRT